MRLRALSHAFNQRQMRLRAMLACAGRGVSAGGARGPWPGRRMFKGAGGRANEKRTLVLRRCITN